MSLLESCLVLVIASTAMTISAPSLIHTRETYILKSAARDVATKMHAARIGAIARNRDCRLRIVSPAQYVVECQGATWELIDNVTLPRGMTVTGNARPEFHRRGNVSPTATFTVWNRAGQSVRVVVNVNGRVRIQ